MEKREKELLLAAYQYIRNVYQSNYADALGITVNYDEAECDGFCLGNDISYLLDLPEVDMPMEE